MLPPRGWMVATEAIDIQFVSSYGTVVILILIGFGPGLCFVNRAVVVGTDFTSAFSLQKRVRVGGWDSEGHAVRG
jgi:hypothetical protein